MIEFIQAHMADLLVLAALAVRMEMAIAKLTKNTTDDAIAAKVADLLAKVGVDVNKPQ